MVTSHKNDRYAAIKTGRQYRVSKILNVYSQQQLSTRLCKIHFKILLQKPICIQLLKIIFVTEQRLHVKALLVPMNPI